MGILLIVLHPLEAIGRVTHSPPPIRDLRGALASNH